MSCQIKVPATLFKKLVAISERDGWALDPEWTLWQRGNTCPVGNRTLVDQLVATALYWAILAIVGGYTFWTFNNRMLRRISGFDKDEVTAVENCIMRCYTMSSSSNIMSPIKSNTMLWTKHAACSQLHSSWCCQPLNILHTWNSKIYRSGKVVFQTHPLLFCIPYWPRCSLIADTNVVVANLITLQTPLHRINYFSLNFIKYSQY